jgi:ribosome-associated toxin RatA of RatAB toxin-antitoxin module
MVSVAVIAIAVLTGGPGEGIAAAASEDASRHVTVTEDRGVYSVKAAFISPQPLDVVFAVLTDYAAIPKFMPQVRTSVVRERGEGRAVIEQEAIARFLMFTRRIHLVLEVSEEASTIRFRDLCGQSFREYEGVWQLQHVDGQTRVQYALTAKPSFAVPEFLLGRLLKRDASQMIKGLQIEMERREASGRR